MKVGATTSLTLRIGEVSNLLGLVRSAIEESRESIEDNIDDEQVAWDRERLETLVPLEQRLVAAGRRLQRGAS